MKGPKGELVSRIPPGLTVSIEDGEVRSPAPATSRSERAFHGLLRSLVANSVEGVTKGFTQGPRDRGRRLQGRGQGQERSSSRSATRTRSTSRSPRGSAIALDAKAGKLTVTGADRQKVGQTAAEIRKLRVPDPYKAKGIKYAERSHPAQGRKGGREVSHESAKQRDEARRRVRVRIQQKVRGSGERPRLAVFKSGKHIYAQVIDDASGRTLAHASSLDAGLKKDRARRARTSRPPSASASSSPSARRRRASPRSYSTAAATSTTARSRRWPTPPAKAAWSSRVRADSEGQSTGPMKATGRNEQAGVRARRASGRRSATRRGAS